MAPNRDSPEPECTSHAIGNPGRHLCRDEPFRRNGTGDNAHTTRRHQVAPPRRVSSTRAARSKCSALSAVDAAPDAAKDSNSAARAIWTASSGASKRRARSVAVCWVDIEPPARVTASSMYCHAPTAPLARCPRRRKTRAITRAPSSSNVPARMTARTIHAGLTPPSSWFADRSGRGSFSSGACSAFSGFSSLCGGFAATGEI